MKRFLVFILFGFFCQFAWGQIPSTIDTAEWKIRKKGKLNAIYTIEQRYDTTKGEYFPSSKNDTISKMICDREGREIELSSYHDKYRYEKDVYKYYYDATGQLLRSEREATGSHRGRMEKYYYDSTGKLIRQDFYLSKEDSYLTGDTAYMFFDYITFSYGEDGLLKERTGFTFQDNSGIPKPDFTEYYYYNKNGKQISSCRYDYMGKDTTSMDTSIYDGRGNKIQYSYYYCSKDDSTDKLTRTEENRDFYTFDIEGNLIETKSFELQGDSLVMTESGKFFYKKGIKTGAAGMHGSYKYIFDKKKKDEVIAVIEYDVKGIPIRKLIYLRAYYK
jgi:hypothetical protein